MSHSGSIWFRFPEHQKSVQKNGRETPKAQAMDEERSMRVRFGVVSCGRGRGGIHRTSFATA